MHFGKTIKAATTGKMRIGSFAVLLLPVAALQPATPIYLRATRLVGGPAFLPLHVQIAVGETAFDFLPAKPTAAATTARLLTGGSVDGLIRVQGARSTRSPRGRWHRVGQTTRTLPEIRRFAEQQPTELSLLHNSCWTFAAAMWTFATRDAQ